MLVQLDSRSRSHAFPSVCRHLQLRQHKKSIRKILRRKKARCSACRRAPWPKLQQKQHAETLTENRFEKRKKRKAALGGSTKKKIAAHVQRQRRRHSADARLCTCYIQTLLVVAQRIHLSASATPASSIQIETIHLRGAPRRLHMQR